MGVRGGYFYGVTAYLWWGGFPLFFMLLAAVDPFEVVPWRVLTALLFCLILIASARRWGALGEILRRPRMLAWFAVSGLLLYINWQIFVIAVVTGRIIETALGFFINPVVTILIGVLVRRERLRPAQWAAVGIATLGVLIISVASGGFPWIALGIAVTFGLYGAVRKLASEHVDALTGLTVETLVTAPLAVAQLVFIGLFFGGLRGFDHGAAVTLPLLLSGLVTAVPLLLFGEANRRLPLSHLGFIQFISPILNFLTGWLVFGERMDTARWIGFATVWLALALLLGDVVGAIRRSRSRLVTPEPAPVTGEIGIAPRS